MAENLTLASLLAPAKHTFVEVLSPYGWVFVVAYLAAALSTPVFRELARRWGIVDKPDGFLKPHAHPIAYLGGLPVYLGWTGGMLLVAPSAGRGGSWLFGLMAAGGLAVVLGLVDDIRNLRPAVKLLGQVAAAGILLAFGIGQQMWAVVLKPLHVTWPDWLVLAFSIPTTVLLVVGAANATNLLDGIDGLCSGVTGIISLSFLILATHLAMYGYSETHDQVRIVASLAMFGAVCGFLPYNSSPATIFLGDAGSMLMGVFAAGMIITFGERGIARWVLGSIMIFGLPILDTSMALLRRLRLRRPIFAGDRSHFYDQLIDRGFTVKQTVGISYGLAGFYGVTGLSVILIRARYGLVIYGVVAALTLYLCHRWGFLKPPEDSPREHSGTAATEQIPHPSRDDPGPDQA